MTVSPLPDTDWFWESGSAEESFRAGEALGRLLRRGDVVALFGELGSGKTVMVRGIAAGLGCDADEVHSPSFTLVNEYPYGESESGGGAPSLAHIDLYRIHSENEVPGIGWDEYMSSRFVVAVEWAERALSWLPHDHIRVRLESRGPERRRFFVLGTGPRSIRVVQDWFAVLAACPE